MPSSEFNDHVGAQLCADGSYIQDICAMEIFMLCGFNPAQLNEVGLN
jgi:hypothetical protein